MMEGAGLLEKLEGTLERVIYYNQKNSYLVGQLSCPDRDTITIVGSFPPLQEGEALQVSGQWQLHPRYGRQLVVEKWQRLLPKNEKGLVRYLSSGLIKGIGPVTASRIVGCFGLEALSVIESQPERLLEVAGIGVQKAALIRESLREHREIEQVMVFLQGHGIGVGTALRLYRHYGSRAVDRVKEDPYHLAEEVYGIGFKIADRIAQNLGLPAEAPRRVQAAVLYALDQAAEEGHVFLPRPLLAERVGKLIFDDPAQAARLPLEDHLQELQNRRRIYYERSVSLEAVYRTSLFHAESEVAARLRALADLDHTEDLSTRIAVADQASAGGISLTGEQLQVLELALHSGALVITGGPGTGKTTTIRALLALFEAMKLQVLLAAPTGRAAKRVTEASGREALTIHRLLEYSYQKDGFQFQRHERRPVEAQAVIVDEASMIDLPLMSSLLKALPPGCRLILVGDVDQLPSVGAGCVLRDVITSGRLPCVRLQNIFRQARESAIVVNAHRVNQGQFPVTGKRESDFYFINEEDPEEVARIVVQLCRERIPNYGPFDPLQDIQVLAPMRRTAAGVDHLNQLLQKELNPLQRGKHEFGGKGAVFRLGDKVMQLRNNYQKEVFNGDIGMVTAIDLEESELQVEYPHYRQFRRVSYDLSEVDELTLSYAISVHKSQGSEYPVVIMPVVTQHYPLLQRNLLYTAITRARKMVVLVGSKKALAIAVRNNRVTERHSRLSERLLEGGEPAIEIHEGEKSR